MARELVDVQRNILRISDAISGGIISLYYRLPTNEERIAFQRASLVRNKGAGGKKQVTFDPNAARQKYGLAILTGFGDDAFTVNGKPVSSDPESQNYLATWKELVGETASDMVAALAVTVFEGMRVAPAEMMEGDELDEFMDELIGDTISDGGEGAEVPLPSS